MLRSLTTLAVTLVLGAGTALASPGSSPAFDVQHFAFSISDTNPCTGHPMTVNFVEDFYVHVRRDGSLNGIIEVTTWTDDGYSNGGPRVIGSWIENARAGTDVLSTSQHDRMANDAGQTIDVHINVKIVTVDGRVVAFRADPPKLTCVGRK